MAPKIVNKDERRREIALACYDLILQGIRKITVAQVAKTAGIGKGTVYEYFENKEDIIFEIINIHIQEYHDEFLSTIENLKSTREKILFFFNFVTDDSEKNIQHMNGYKDYLSVVLSEENENMKDFNTDCNEFFTTELKKVIEEGISNNELIPESMNFIDGLMSFEKGLVLMKMTQNCFDAKEVCENFVNSLFELIEVKR